MNGIAASAGNLRAIEADEALLSECRSAHLREAALILCKGTDLDGLRADFDTFRDRYKSACAEMGGICRMDANDRAVLCSHIADILCGNRRKEFILKNFFSADEMPAAPVICYLRNPIADLAYTEFTRALPRAGVMYADSFQSVCENLIGGECDHAILPVVSGSDGRLIRFEGMIASYGFAVSALVSVTPNAESEPDTFALLSRNVELPPPREGMRTCLAFSVPDGTDIASLLSAARLNGFEALDIRTQSYSERKNWSLTLDITNGRTAPFLAYLALENAGFVANGIFTV